MKITTSLLLGISITTALAAIHPAPGSAAEAEAKAQCGALGVMYFNSDDLPEGVTPDDVRMCRDHPLGWKKTPDDGWAGERIRGLLPGWMF
ncbi:hypothetical protein BJY04DRAFT_201586 [Aspergillus karnatakaensis]|uniref:uncharacterized protein n=1 Tax=Aspergillus karnatakaensis TaxID=1810916 RepID=UPI003CCCED4C